MKRSDRSVPATASAASARKATATPLVRLVADKTIAVFSPRPMAPPATWHMYTTPLRA